MAVHRLLLVWLLVVSAVAPALAIDLPLGERTLSYGSWGGDVFRLQQHLVQAGYDVTVDGHFGSATRSAVTAFQVANGLEPDGIVGPATVAALLAVRPMVAYTVQPGDSLWSIARKFDTTMEELIATNNLPPRPLYIGERLYVPVRPTYRVRPGDTLWEIARLYGTSVFELVELNGINDPSTIRVGQQLTLPRGSEPSQPGF